MEIRKYYEKEARLLSDHQKKMYFGDPWTRYWHGTRFAMLLEIMKNLKFRNFLDVGCAEGYYLKAVANKADSPEQVGLDISKAYLIKAKIKASEAAFVLGDASNLPFKTNCFDLVFCSEVLEHIQDPKKVFSELTRTSKKYVLLTVAGENLFYYLTNKLKLIKPEEEPYAKIGHGHIHEMRINEIITKWAPENHLKTIKYIVDCHFPIAYLQRHKMPTLLIPLIRIADKLINQLPVVKEYGSSQIGLLENPAHQQCSREHIT
jgi:ubiquinone/menaquinone biosynthesis C-methylase UbiE